MNALNTVIFRRVIDGNAGRMIRNCLVILVGALSYPSTGRTMSCTVYCPDGSRPNVDCNSTADPCASGGRSGGSSYNYEAARRAQQAAAAAAAAAAEERRRQDEEDDRIERLRQAEEQRKKEARDAEFIRNRDKTVLKGSIGTSASSNSAGLKGSSSAVNTGLKLGSASDRPTPGIQGQHAAWKQLHCAAALSGYAFAAVKQATPDYQESSFLLAQASNALSGQALNVECPAAPPFPDLRGRAVDMDRVKQTEEKILGRAVVIVERMKQRTAPTTGALVAPAKKEAETSDEKMRRVQKELNRANSQKITGKTKAEINEQERDRKELAKLILANEQLEKGELISISADTAEKKSPRSRRKAAPASK